MDISWDDLRLFLAIAETGSLSGAARTLSIGQPTVSRRLAGLEYALGAALFHRSVEGASLTVAGERMLGPAKRMAEWAGEVGRAAERVHGAPTGLVRVTAPPFVCSDFLAPFAASLSKSHPGIRIELISAMHYLDIARGEAEIALRVRPASQPELTLVHTRSSENAVFVSKSLAKKLGRPKELSDLPWIGWAPPHDHLPPNPQLEAFGIRPAFTSDSFLVNLAAAESGVGAIVLPSRPHRFSKQGHRLVPLDLDLGPHASGEIYLVCAKSALDIPRVRVVADLLVKELEWNP